MLKIILLAVGLLLLAMAGLGIKLLFNRDAEFSGGSCNTASKDLQDRGIGCGCGGHCALPEDL